MDCTHVGWHKCPVDWTNLMTGASGKPSIAFQVVVDHNRMILHCSKWFYGTWNDKQITVQDTYPIKLMQGLAHRYVLYNCTYCTTNTYIQILPLIFHAYQHSDRTFRTYGVRGDTEDYLTWQGAYVLVYGGYQHIQVHVYLISNVLHIIITLMYYYYYYYYYQAFMNPMHDHFSKWELFWSEWVESIRKDVECTFSTIKCQWRFLRNKVEYHDPLIIEAAMHTACMLHNMLLLFKGYDTFEWDSVDPDDDEPIHDEQTYEQEPALSVPANGIAPIPQLGEMTQLYGGIIGYHPHVRLFLFIYINLY
jgi:hypothetical protein